MQVLPDHISRNNSSHRAPNNQGHSLIAFVTSSFGFGPVSKAVTIAEEFRKQMPDLRLDFFGSGIDYDFACKTECFDEIYQVNVDDNDSLRRLLPVLTNYQAVFSILNLGLLPMWRKEWGKLYFVDSLAWMWRDLPTGVENVEAYFVQDYLLQPERAIEWQKKSPLIVVSPIVNDPNPKGEVEEQNSAERGNLLLVNFSGCSNPFVGPEVFENYVLTLSGLIINLAASRFDRVQICCNQTLAELLQSKLGERERLQIDHLAPKDFYKLLQNSTLLLTAPGITTTLEAFKTHTPIGFLLPQNDSQAIISEIYRRQFGEDICMALSSFGEEFTLAENTVDQNNPAAPAQEVAKKLEFILTHRQKQINQKLEVILSSYLMLQPENVLQNIRYSWEKTGQEMIVEHVNSSLFNFPAESWVVCPESKN